MPYSKTKIAIVTGEFNSVITEKLEKGALTFLLDKGLLQANIKVVKVPGAIEIPLVTKLLAKSKKYQAIICLGAVIRGETTHYDYVCQQVSSGCQSIMLTYEIPVIFGVLTTENREQALDRISFDRKGHKGAEAAEAALYMINTVSNL